MARVMFEPFHVSHARIFGNKPPLHGRNVTSQRPIVSLETDKEEKPDKNKRLRKIPKSVCPHCSTKNFRKIGAVTSKCKKCGFEG